MGIIDLLVLIFGALKGYGAIGLFAAAGWSLLAFHYWTHIKKKNYWEESVQKKDQMLMQKDVEIRQIQESLTATVAELSNHRINDLKESSDELAELCNKTIFTLDRLTIALNVYDHKDN